MLPGGGVEASKDEDDGGVAQYKRQKGFPHLLQNAKDARQDLQAGLQPFSQQPGQVGGEQDREQEMNSERGMGRTSISTIRAAPKAASTEKYIRSEA